MFIFSVYIFLQSLLQIAKEREIRMKRTHKQNSLFQIFTKHYKAIVICFCFVLGILNMTGAKTNSPKAEAATSNQKHYKCITIDADDTLWTIAQENYSEEYDSYEDYIDEVKFINNLTNDTIYNGATLVVPYYSAPS